MINKSVIYQIKNIKNNRIYIGQTINFEKRKYIHFHTLKNNKHENKFLQRDYNKCGENNFRLYIIEYCKPEKLNELEQDYLNVLWDNCNNCYNINLLGSKPPNAKGRKLSKKQIEAMSGEFASFYGKTHSIETKKRLSNIRRGIGRPHLEGTKEKLRKNKNNGKQTNIYLSDKNNITYGPIYNIKKFGIENDIDSRRIYELVSGKRKSYKGWKYISGTILKKEREDFFLTKNNTIYGPISNIGKFCKEHKIIRTNIYKLLSGKRISVNGFELYVLST